MSMSKAQEMFMAQEKALLTAFDGKSFINHLIEEAGSMGNAALKAEQTAKDYLDRLEELPKKTGIEELEFVLANLRHLSGLQASYDQLLEVAVDALDGKPINDILFAHYYKYFFVPMNAMRMTLKSVYNIDFFDKEP